MGGFRSQYDCASKRVLNALKTRDFVSSERKVEGVAVVKFRMKKRRDNNAGSVEIEDRASTAKVTDVKETAARDRIKLLR